MKKLILFIVFILLTVSSFADGISGSAAITNNYVARGTAQNYDQTPVLMFNVNYDYKGFYLGFFTANVDFQEDHLGLQSKPTYRELSGWAGYRTNIGKITLDTMFGSYNYIGDTFTALDMVEFKTALSIPIGKFTVSSSCGYTPDYFNVLGRSIWADFGVSYQFNEKITFSVGLGRQFIPNKGGSNVMIYNPDGYSYTTWNAGLTYNLNKNWSIDVHYYNTDRHDLGSVYTHNPYGDNIAATFKFNF